MLCICNYLLIGESYFYTPSLLQILCSLVISLDLNWYIVIFSINLNAQVIFAAEKVCNTITYNMLSPKLMIQVLTF